MIFRILGNDPTGDAMKYGEAIAWILMIARFIWATCLGVLMLGMGIGILVVFGMAIKLLMLFIGLFITPVPFLER